MAENLPRHTHFFGLGEGVSPKPFVSPLIDWLAWLAKPSQASQAIKGLTNGFGYPSQGCRFPSHFVLFQGKNTFSEESKTWPNSEPFLTDFGVFGVVFAKFREFSRFCRFFVYVASFCVVRFSNGNYLIRGHVS